jgi:hypothetical protein
LILLAIIIPLRAQTTISGTQVNYPIGFGLQTGSWCFNGACATVTNGSFSGTFTEGTATVTVTSGAQTILTVPGVTISTSTYDWDNFVAPAGAQLSGMGSPTIPCATGAAYQQTDSFPPYQGYGCTSVGGAPTWVAQGTPPVQLVINLPVNAITTNTTVTAAAPGSVRSIIGQITTTNSSYANGSGSIVGVRGLATIPSGTTASAGYIYGTQGKAVIAGTLNGSQWTFGLYGQLDISGAQSLSSNPPGGYLAPLWSDAGATGPSVTCSSCNSIGVTNTTATTFNSILFAASKAGYFVDAANLTNSGGWIASSSASSACTTTYLLKVKTAGGDGYIHVCSN